jgi:hypothetical protein
MCFDHVYSSVEDIETMARPETTTKKVKLSADHMRQTRRLHMRDDAGADATDSRGQTSLSVAMKHRGTPHLGPQAPVQMNKD